MKNGITNSLGTKITDFESWKKAFLEVDEAKHWKEGRSACSLAHFFTSPSFENSDGESLIRQILSDLQFQDVQLCHAEIEHESRFDRYKGKQRMQDLSIWAKSSRGPVAINIEAKVDEPFGSTIQEAYDKAVDYRNNKNQRSKAANRIEDLVSKLYPNKDFKSVSMFRYQLTYYVAGSITEAQKISGVAVLPVIVFETELYNDKIGSTNLSDYESFMESINLTKFSVNGRNYYHGIVNGIEVYTTYIKAMKSRRSKYRGVGIDKDFANSFKQSELHTKIYAAHSQDLILGIRNNSINLYYNCDSIAKINRRRDHQIISEIATYYLNGTHGEDPKRLPSREFVDSYDTIVKYSNMQLNDEKKAQHRLVVSNNNNSASKWFCLDVEYKKRYLNNPDREGNFNGRFDIVAISKAKPHRIAIIELKSGSGAIQGNAGIRNHIRDFVTFNGLDKDGHSYFDEFKEEVIKILNAESLLIDNVPASLKGLSVADITQPLEFYVITLDNNACGEDASTPQMIMSGQLFRDRRWGCKRISSLVNSEGDYFALVKNSKDFKTTFLFSSKTWKDLDKPEIKNNMDIINSSIYDDPITL